MYRLVYKNNKNKLPMRTKAEDFKAVQKRIDDYLQKGYEIIRVEKITNN